MSPRKAGQALHALSAALFATAGLLQGIAGNPGAAALILVAALMQAAMAVGWPR